MKQNFIDSKKAQTPSVSSEISDRMPPKALSAEPTYHGRKPVNVDFITDRITTWMGSTGSIILHTFLFTLAFATHWLFGWAFDFILLVLTTIVSLEAIYLALFIQRTVNQQAVRLHEVEENLDDIEESIDEVEKNLDDVEEALDEVEETLTEAEDDIADISTATVKQLEQPLDEVVAEIKVLLDELKETMKSKK